MAALATEEQLACASATSSAHKPSLVEQPNSTVLTPGKYLIVLLKQFIYSVVIQYG